MRPRVAEPRDGERDEADHRAGTTPAAGAHAGGLGSASSVSSRTAATLLTQSQSAERMGDSTYAGTPALSSSV